MDSLEMCVQSTGYVDDDRDCDVERPCYGVMEEVADLAYRGVLQLSSNGA